MLVWVICLSVVFYLVFGMVMFNYMQIKVYKVEDFADLSTSEEDLVVLGSVFWPITILIVGIKKLNDLVKILVEEFLKEEG